MHPTDPCPEQDPPHDRRQQAALYASLELSRSTWLVTSLAPGDRKMSKHSAAAGDGAALLALLARLRGRVERSAGGPVGVAVVQEAGMDGFWVHRLLEAEGVESHVVDPASVAAPRRQRRAKTDAIDGETLLRTLLAWWRGEPRVCAMVVPPTPGEEDRRRLILTALVGDRFGPLAAGDRGEPVRRRHEPVPRLAAGRGAAVVALPDAMAELVLAQVLPDVLDRVQLGRVGRERQQGEVPGDGEVAGAVPPGAVEHAHAVRPGRDRAADLDEVQAGGRRVGVGQDQGGADGPLRADRAEQVGPRVATVAGRPRPGAAARPHPGQGALP